MLQDSQRTFLNQMGPMACTTRQQPHQRPSKQAQGKICKQST